MKKKAKIENGRKKGISVAGEVSVTAVDPEFLHNVVSAICGYHGNDVSGNDETESEEKENKCKKVKNGEKHENNCYEFENSKNYEKNAKKMSQMTTNINSTGPVPCLADSSEDSVHHGGENLLHTNFEFSRFVNRW